MLFSLNAFSSTFFIGSVISSYFFQLQNIKFHTPYITVVYKCSPNLIFFGLCTMSWGILSQFSPELPAQAKRAEEGGKQIERRGGDQQRFLEELDWPPEWQKTIIFWFLICYPEAFSSVLCQLSYLFWPGRLKMPLNVSELGLNMIWFISNLYGGAFLYRPGPVISTCMLKKDVMVTPTLPRGKN